MAWVDDRIYCHSKVMRVGKPARWTFVAGIAYSSAWGTKGTLEPGEQEAIGSNAKLRAELVTAGLWEEGDGGAVLIHDWDDHNDKRDARREKDRERKRNLRKSQRLSAGQSTGQSPPVSALTACVEGSEGIDGKEISKAVLVARPPALGGDSVERPQFASDEVQKLIDVSLKEVDAA